MKYIKKNLKNGMTIVLVPTKEPNLVTMGFFVKAGSRDEYEDESGIAHFLEHMMFKGTKNRNAADIFKELDTIGAEYNAVTTPQYTYYYVSGNADNTKKLLDIILDIYLNAVFKNQEIAKEKKVVIEEMRLRNDAPFAKLYTQLNKKMFKGTSLERSVIGTMDTVESLTKKDLESFKNELYTPENSIFVITGNFNPVPIYKIIKRLLGSINKNETPKNEKIYDNEKEIIIRNMEKQNEPYIHIEKNKNFQQAYVIIAFPLYDLYNEYGREIDLISKLLSYGFSSRLSKSLREKKGITYSSSSYTIDYFDVAMYMISLVINPNELDKGLKIIMKELRKLKKELINKEELKKIKNVSEKEMIYSLIMPMNVLLYFGLNLLMDPSFDADYNKEISKIKKIKRENIKNIANKIFLEDKINLFVYGNVTDTNFDFLKL